MNIIINYFKVAQIAKKLIFRRGATHTTYMCTIKYSIAYILVLNNKVTNPV